MFAIGTRLAKQKLAIIDHLLPLTRGLTGYVALDEGGGSPVARVTNSNLVILGGHRLTATANGTPTWSNARFGWCRDYSSSASEWIERGAWCEPSTGVSAFAFVQRTGTNGNWARPFGKTANEGGSPPYWAYDMEYNPGGSGQDAVQGGVTTSVSQYVLSATYSDTTVPHLTGVTYDGSTVRIYQNEFIRGSTSASGTISYDTTSSGRMILSGSSSSGAGNVWIGKLWYLAVWNRGLSPAEVKLLAQNPFFLQANVRRLAKAPAAPPSSFIPYPRPRGLDGGMSVLFGGLC